MSTIKQLISKHKKAEAKLKKIEEEINETLGSFIGQEVRLSKKCKEWYAEYGEECGVPFDELNAILKRPKGVIKKATFDRYEEWTFRVDFGLEELPYINVGVEDIE